ncbi:hypothetical protein CSC03_1976 [Enterobacter hormaechei]|nr:hypothetical protein CSC19_4217 [Enterobacter hormaechei]AWZ95753.1 hypothetical protein CSB67_4717 [Enterobacter hormaechei]KAF0681112.1 hypothetical protein Y59_11850 [Enterobacter hormaechei]PRW22171.1 hypothetical protein CSC03_1976 [Enterobacter hormaechei]RAL72469.1 hypothetical protein CSC35_0928 [Enterobacter hormaechei]
MRINTFYTGTWRLHLKRNSKGKFSLTTGVMPLQSLFND